MNTDSREVMGPQHPWLGCQNTPNGERVRLAPRGVAVRLAAAGCAVVVTALTVGMQIGIVAVYSGELDASMAALKAQPPASLVASACDPAPVQAGGTDDAQTADAADAPRSRRVPEIPCQ